MTLPAPVRAAVQQQVLRQRTSTPSTPPRTPRLFSVWMGSDIPAHYTSVEQMAQAAMALAPAGDWDGVELLLKAGEGGSWQSAFDRHPLALNGPARLASHIQVAKALWVRIVPYVVVRARSAWIADEQAMIRECVRVAGRCVLNVEPEGEDSQGRKMYYNGPLNPGFIRGYLGGIGVRADALEVCLIPRFTQVAELGGVECLQAWTDPALVGRASWETYGLSAPGPGISSLQVDVAIPRLDGWSVPPGLNYRVPVCQRDERDRWAPTIWAAGGLAIWWCDGN